MHEHFWTIVMSGGGAFALVMLWSAWQSDRNSASYRRQLKLAEELTSRQFALLTGQEQLLRRIETLLERLERKLGE